MLKKLKNFIRVYSTFHIPDKRKNIFLFSSPRSGSTWLLEILMTQSGYKWVREPDNIRNKHVQKYLGITDWVEMYNKSALPKIDSYIGTLASKNIKDIGFKYPAPFSEYWRFITHGTIFKLLHAFEPYIDHFKNTFNGKIVFLIRHPIPVSLSREDFPRLHAYIESDYKENFTPEQLLLASNIIENGSRFEKAILDWCLQNAVPLKNKKADWLLIYYEDLVQYPDKVIDSISKELNFPNKEKMFSRLHVASSSSKKSKAETQTVIFDAEKLKENKQWLLNKWVNKVTPKEKEAAQLILDAFNIKIYNANDILPQKIEHTVML